MARLGPDSLQLNAPAKINLNLLAGPRRADGFHPLDSYVSKVALYDQVLLRGRSDGQIGFHCRGADCGDVEQNLAVRAARLLKQCHPSGGADIELAKNIPPGKGLGGGSSDAAAVLRGLNELWSLRLDEPALQAHAERLGSDVPLFLGGACCRMTGRGEIIEPARIHSFVAVLLLSDLACSTAEVYRACDRRPIVLGRQLDGRLLAEEPPSVWRGLLENQLAAGAREVCPPFGRLWDELSACAGLPVCMSGSGSALFVLCDDGQEAGQVLARLPRHLGERCMIVGLNDW